MPTCPSNSPYTKDTHQAHVMIGGRGYNAYDERRTGLYLLNNILGGPGMNSRLNVSLREKRGLVYNVESNLTAYTDTGTFCIYFGCDQEDADYCTELVHKELKKVMRPSAYSHTTTRCQKTNHRTNRSSKWQLWKQCTRYGKMFLHYKRCEGKEEVFRRIESLTSAQLLDIANEMFSAERLSILSYKWNTHPFLFVYL